jgi:glucan phosphoethanolaminetransferase (alkaline phosphatase superfamily)
VKREYVIRVVWCLWLAIALVAYLSSCDWLVFARLLGMGSNHVGPPGVKEIFGQATFISLHLVAFLLIATLPYLRVLWGALLAALLAVSYVIECSFFAIRGRILTLSDIVILNGALGNTGDALQQFSHSIIGSAGKAAILFIPPLLLGIFAEKPKSIHRLSLIGLFMLAAAYGGIAFVRGEHTLAGFPLPVSYYFGTAVIAADNFATGGQAKVSVESFGAKRVDRLAKRIVLLIDESIEGNEFAKIAALSSNAADFGIAYSVANCSATANYAIRRGIRVGQALAPAPSLFSLAKRAGYATVYIDGQNVLGDLAVRDYFDDAELKDVDEVVGPGRTPSYDRDLQSLDVIVDRLQSKEPVFILENKVGAHFPYQTSIPPAEASTDRLDNYVKSVRRNSSDFLAKLAARLPADTVVIYTSDHGQNLHGSVTHCSLGAEATVSEWRVPLVVLADQANTLWPELRMARESAFNKLTHFEMTESVRHLLGYRSPRVASIFDLDSLSALPSTHCGLYGPSKGLLGVAPKCLPFDKQAARAAP